MRFGDFVRERRLACGYSMGRLARELGVTTTFVSDVERGYSRMKAERIPELARILKVPQETLDTMLAAEKGSMTLASAKIPERAQGAVAMLGRETHGQQFWDEFMKLIERHKESSS